MNLESQACCTNCNSINLETDSSKGIVYCEDCGMLQEENLIVNTLQFDNEGSKVTLKGKMVTTDNVNIGTSFVDSTYYIRNTITNICTKLTLDANHIDVAFRWYKLSLQHNITKGKSILYTLSACVYISCRISNTPHMLIDFSEALRIDVHKIGKVFLKMRSVFRLEIGLLDPTLYMHRFVAQMRFKNKSVLTLSMRLMKRMKKDWIIEGRHPNNSCGAAILIASRICNEPREIEHIAKVVHASVATIAKRVKEMKNTETANLYLDQFQETWIEKEENPPIAKIERIIQETNQEDSIVTENNFDSEEYILNPGEVERKTLLWESMYTEDEIKKNIIKKTNKSQDVHKKHKKKYNFESVEDALRSLDKKVTSKLNFSVIERLFEDD